MASPRSLEDLQSQAHRTIHFSTRLGARPHGWEYPDGDRYKTLQLPGALHVNSAQTYEAAALVGLGLIQAPLMGIGRYLKSGELVEIVPDLRRQALEVSPRRRPSEQPVAPRSNLHGVDRRCTDALSRIANRPSGGGQAQESPLAAGPAPGTRNSRRVRFAVRTRGRLHLQLRTSGRCRKSSLAGARHVVFPEEGQSPQRARPCRSGARWTGVRPPLGRADPGA